MSDITIGFKVDTAPLLAADAALEKLGRTAASTEAIFAKFAATSAASFAKVPVAFGGTGGGGIAAPVAAQAGLAASIAKTTTVIGAQTEALGRVATAHQSHGAAAAKTALALAEVEHIGRAFIDTMAAGGNPLRLLAMESGRLQIALQNGLGEALGSVATRALGFVNPITLGGAAVAGLGAAAYLATSHVRDLQIEMARAVGGAGRYTGLSGSGLDRLASSQASSFNAAQLGMSIGDTRDAAMSLARTGRLDPANISSITGLVPGYAGLTGTSNSEAGDKLASIFSDPARGMGELEKATGALDDRSRQLVLSYQAQGDAQAAVRTLVDRTSTALNEMVQPQSGWGRFTTWWENRNAQVEGAIAGVVSGPSPAQQYNDASRMGGGPGMLGFMQSRGLYDDGTSNLAEDFRHRGMLTGGSPFMRSEADTLLVNQRSQAAGDIIRSMVPESVARQGLQDRQTSLSTALANPGVMDALGPNAKDATEALGRLNVALETFKTPLQRLVEEGDLAIRQASARTAAERAAVDAESAYGRTLDSTHDKLQAGQAATNSWAEAIASSTRTALDSLRSTSDRASLVGLSPYDRIMRENDNRFRDMQEKVVSGPLAARTAIMAPAGGAAVMAPGTGMTNPGNIRNGPWAAGQPGYAGGGAFAAFDSPASGYRAANALLDQYARQGINTPSAIINKWAPAADHNDPVAYAKTVRGVTGLDPNSPITAADRPALLYGMTRVEHGSSPYSRTDIAGMLNGGATTPAVPGTAMAAAVDPGTATLANRTNFAIGRQADVSDLLMSGPQRAATQIQEQASTFQALQGAMGQSAAAIAAATEKQREWNQVTADGVTQQKLMTNFGEAGAKMWTDLGSRIDTNAAAAGRLAAAQDQQKSLIGTEDSIRSFTSNSADTLFTGLAEHKPANQLLRGIGLNLGESLIRGGVGTITNGLFGKQGQAGGGLFGGLLGSLFGGHMFAGGTNDAPGGPALVGEKGPEIVNLPAHAQVISNSALAGMRAPPGHTFNIGGPTINVQGDVSEQNRAEIQRAVAAGQQQTVEHITRNLPQIQADSAQTS